MNTTTGSGGAFTFSSRKDSAENSSIFTSSSICGNPLQINAVVNSTFQYLSFFVQSQYALFLMKSLALNESLCRGDYPQCFERLVPRVLQHVRSACTEAYAVAFVELVFFVFIVELSFA